LPAPNISSRTTTMINTSNIGGMIGQMGRAAQ
jgi:hypothetical protein